MLKVPEMDIGFAVNARSIKANENFRKMKEVIKEMIDSFGRTKIRYTVMVIGDEPVMEISFSDVFPSDMDLKRQLDTLSIPTG